MKYWYAARPNEVFLDLDSRRALLRALKVIRAYRRQKRPTIIIDEVYHYPTGRPGHCHMVLVLRHSLEATKRAELALWMGSDRLRACFVMARIGAAFKDHADLLVTSRVYHRPADQQCMCSGKHKRKSITNKCHALRMFLGPWRSFDFYPRAGKQWMKPFRVPIGRVSLESIRLWRSDGKR